ncbi:hypothetical protein CRENBAI_013217 [Crenichthys baileyi]|uniref:Serpin domain-containing protein n=1 Tax=Crenichthys baileyi TaxID=28760 RepID=A0AAV9RY79_9TELE
MGASALLAEKLSLSSYGAGFTPKGLGSLFLAPDLSGISDQPLRVSSVRHVTTMELSEEGVEASATTVVTAMRSISLFSVNSPFLFALVDDLSLAPLFMGVVTNPAPNNDPMPNDDPNGNNTMNDQPSTETATKTDLKVEHNKLLAGGSTVHSCSAPGGGKEQLQQVGSPGQKQQQPCSSRQEQPSSPGHQSLCQAPPAAPSSPAQPSAPPLEFIFSITDPSADIIFTWFPSSEPPPSSVFPDSAVVAPLPSVCITFSFSSSFIRTTFFSCATLIIFTISRVFPSCHLTIFLSRTPLQSH